MVEKENFEFADKAEKAFNFIEETFPDPAEMRLFIELVIVNSTTFGKRLMQERIKEIEKVKQK